MTRDDSVNEPAKGLLALDLDRCGDGLTTGKAVAAAGAATRLWLRSAVKRSSSRIMRRASRMPQWRL